MVGKKTAMTCEFSLKCLEIMDLLTIVCTEPTIPKCVHVTMLPKVTSSKVSRVAHANQLVRSNHAQRQALVVEAACRWCNLFSIRPCLIWVKKFRTTVGVLVRPLWSYSKLYTVCVHIPHSRSDLYNIVAIKQLKTFEDIMKAVGRNPDSLGCELCKPAIASILSSLFNGHIMDHEYHELQETNDRFLANIQRNGTFSVVPRVPGGEITADKLITIGQVAKKYNLYCKITGGQRIDMFGAKKQDLLDIWTELVNAGMESGHAYAKSLRTIKVRGHQLI